MCNDKEKGTGLSPYVTSSENERGFSRRGTSFDFFSSLKRTP